MSAVEKASLPTIGQAYGGGFVTGITRDSVTGNCFLIITAGGEHEIVGAWGEYGVKIEGAESFWDGRSNTEAMAAAGSKIAQAVLLLTIGGHSDWSIPARDQQELQYRHCKPTADTNYCWNRDGDNPHSVPVGQLYTPEFPIQTTMPGFGPGEPEAFKPRAYWSSTQRSANGAFYMLFDGGYQGNLDKFNELRVRPVRSVLID